MLTSMQDVAPAPPGTRIAYSRGEFQFGELRVPSGSGPHPVAIVIHGGYWRARYDLTEVGHLCEAVTRQGLATWSLEYRRIGNPGGGWPGTLDDVRLEHWMLRRPRLSRHVPEDLRTRTAGAVRIRVRPQRQVLNCLHELSEVGVCDVVNWLYILHRLPICYPIPNRRIRSLIRPRAREIR